MNNTFSEDEKLYRAVYPPAMNQMFWKDDNHVSSAVFLDKKGLSVERGNHRSDETVVSDMKKSFIGRIIYITAALCKKVNIQILYKPTKRSIYHSELHGGNSHIILSSSQRRFLSENCTLIKEIK